MNAPVTRTAEGLARRPFTVGEVERMVEIGVIPPDERLEIIGGEWGNTIMHFATGKLASDVESSSSVAVAVKALRSHVCSSGHLVP